MVYSAWSWNNNDQNQAKPNQTIFHFKWWCMYGLFIFVFISYFVFREKNFHRFYWQWDSELMYCRFSFVLMVIYGKSCWFVVIVAAALSPSLLLFSNYGRKEEKKTTTHLYEFTVIRAQDLYISPKVGTFREKKGEKKQTPAWCSHYTFPYFRNFGFRRKWHFFHFFFFRFICDK